MPIIYQKFIRRVDLRQNPDRRYVFGDNVLRVGFGGQAKEMRGEPNAIGVVTKLAPSMLLNAFFDDSTKCKELVQADLNRVQDALNRGLTVVVPSDGIGTGLSRLPDVAPNLNKFIQEWFKERS
jgi:hypothetical protein